MTEVMEEIQVLVLSWPARDEIVSELQAKIVLDEVLLTLYFAMPHL